jgi:hypothetical protein
VVHSFEQIAMLEQYAGTQRFAVWLKVDSGMNRLGFRLEELEAGTFPAARVRGGRQHEAADASRRCGECGGLETKLQLDAFAR